MLHVYLISIIYVFLNENSMIFIPITMYSILFKMDFFSENKIRIDLHSITYIIFLFLVFMITKWPILVIFIRTHIISYLWNKCSWYFQKTWLYQEHLFHNQTIFHYRDFAVLMISRTDLWTFFQPRKKKTSGRYLAFKNNNNS